VRRAPWAAVVLLAALAGCTTHPPPDDPPTPPPPPAPPASPAIIDGKWVPALRGATNCCNDEATPDLDEGLVDGWTLITPAALDRIKGPGTVNWTHLRLGPFSEIVDASLSAFSGRDAQRARLLQASVRRYGAGLEILDDARVAGLAAQERGIYVEWDVVDHWALATHGMNFYGDDCSVTHAAPPQRYLDWIKAVVEATWDLPGTYNLGNEGFRCRPLPEWERGLYDALKAALAAKGVSRPIGSTVTVSDTRTAFDYRTYHGWQIPPANWSRDIPAMLTETDNRSHDAAAWAALARAIEAAGHYVSIWRGPESWDSQNGAINAMPRLGEAWPPDDQPPPAPTTDCDGEPGPLTGTTEKTHGTAVNEVMRDLTGCPIGSTCLLGDIPQQTWFADVVKALRARGLCAGQHNPGHTDEIAVAADQWAKREGFHVFAGDDSPGPVPPGGARRVVVWSPGAARPTYFAPEVLPPPPPDPFGCPAPRPLRVWDDNRPHWKINAHQVNRVIDTTAVTVAQEPFCRAIGMSPMADGTLRAECPMRPEDWPVAGERLACERYIAEGDWVLDARNGASCVANPENSAQFFPNGGNCRLCNPAKSVCSGWF
jgi:hypothetical protein